MRGPEAADVVELFMSRLTTDLPDAVHEYAADDLEWRLPASLTGGEPWVGKETVVRRLRRMGDNFAAQSMSVERISTVRNGDSAVIEVDFRAQSANGVPYSNTYVFCFTVNGGRIVSVREYTDTVALLEFMRAVQDAG